MTFTALHRVLGRAPGPLTNEMLDAAVAAGVMETDDLDWKSELPPTKGASSTDFPKDVAAMANSGGGMIVYGVLESQKAATGRVGVGELTEVHERALRSAAITAISPPVFGLDVQMLGGDKCAAVALIVPASVDGPHLIYRGEYFGAPIRNDADTVWMKERQIEAMYRARLDERRRAVETLDRLYAEEVANRTENECAWLVAVAHPRLPVTGLQLTRDDARRIVSTGMKQALVYCGRGTRHPVENVEAHNPRAGLRRWVASFHPERADSGWQEARLSIHRDGSVSWACAVGGVPVSSTENLRGSQVLATRVEAAIADLMGAVRAIADWTGAREYDLRVGIDWPRDTPLEFLGTDPLGYPMGTGAAALRHYSPVEVTVDARADAVAFHQSVHDLALDCVNQGGVIQLRQIEPPDHPA